MSTERLTTAALTIAGSDSCGGAGIQADLKTFAAFGVHGTSAITVLTAQNTLGVQEVVMVPPDTVRAQLTSILADLPVRAAKTGMLGSAATILAVAETLEGSAPDLHLVMDPVMVATSGAVLADEETIAAMRRLIAMAALVTPNTRELAALSGLPVDSAAQMRVAGQRLLEHGCRAVLLKGGHLAGQEVTDVLITSTGERDWSHPRLPGEFHGTGCTLSAALAACLALGADLESAADQAIGFLQDSMQAGRLPLAGKLVLLGQAPRPGAA